MSRAPMNDLERAHSRAATRRKALDRQGAINIYCVCGESDPLCFDADHIYRREYDGTVWAVCSNCHRKKSRYEFLEHPPVGVSPGNLFERLGHRHLGMALYLELTAEHLRADAELMFKAAVSGYIPKT